MYKILSVLGARPQFIKAATMQYAFARVGSDDAVKIDHVIIHTGQHYNRELSQIFFDELGIPEPKYNLGIGSDRQGAQTGKMLVEIERVLLLEKPDIVITYGDTNSTLAAILATSKLQLFSAHVEAGLRSHNRSMPEEINRIVADEFSNLLFCPSVNAVQNLRAEGIPHESARYFDSQRIHLVGDVMYDSILLYRAFAREKSSILTQLNLVEKSYCLATIHRAENTDDAERLISILEGLQSIAGEMQLVLPVHPRTKKAIGNLSNPTLKKSLTRGIQVIDPVGYVDMVQLQANAKAIITDSGGVQKEAYFLGVPCITLRNETEWIETVKAGWNVLVGTDPPTITQGFRTASEWVGTDSPFSERGKRNPEGASIYGDGKAADRIAGIIVESLKELSERE